MSAKVLCGGSPLTSSRCSEDEVSSRLELLPAAGATIREGSAGSRQSLTGMHSFDALPTHQHHVLVSDLEHRGLGIFLRMTVVTVLFCVLYILAVEKTGLAFGSHKIHQSPSYLRNGNGFRQGFQNLGAPSECLATRPSEHLNARHLPSFHIEDKRQICTSQTSQCRGQAMTPRRCNAGYAWTRKRKAAIGCCSLVSALGLLMRDVWHDGNCRTPASRASLGVGFASGAMMLLA